MILIDLSIFLFVFTTMALWHEICHIKSQGIFATGRIYVEKFSLAAGYNNCKNFELMLFAGGLGASIISFIAALISTDAWQFGFLIAGWTNLVYGIYEGFGHNTRWRYFIYAAFLIGGVVCWVILQ